MRKLSVREFKDLCENLPQHGFNFDSINQDWYSASETMKLKQEFSSIKISFNPNTIYLCSSLGCLKFERVKYIRIEEPSLLGTIFTIVCGDLITNTSNKAYTLIAH